jgi:hypothetical protein
MGDHQTQDQAMEPVSISARKISHPIWVNLGRPELNPHKSLSD